MLKDDPGLWIGLFEKALENHGPVEDIAFPTLFHLLDDSGQTWHFQYRRKNKIISWSELKDDFVECMQKRFIKKLGFLKKQFVANEPVKAYSASRKISSRVWRYPVSKSFKPYEMH